MITNKYLSLSRKGLKTVAKSKKRYRSKVIVCLINGSIFGHSSKLLIEYQTTVSNTPD